jgi:predicted enzyme related to lactoylglutathione lyase
MVVARRIERSPVQTRFQHPGASVLQLRVLSLDPVLERLADSAGQIWTPAGEPVTLGGTTRIIFIQDPDGFFVELIEGTQAAGQPAPPSSNVVGGTFELIIADTDENARFYRAGAGFDPEVADSFDDTKLLTDTVDTPGARFRRTVLTIPGTTVTMAFLEFQGIYRKPLATRVQDPGTAILQLFVDDVPAMTAQLAAAGGTVISTGGGPVDLGGGRLLSIVRDPNNLFLELIPPRTTQ